MQIFLDGFHLYSGAKHLEKNINYTKLIGLLAPQDEYHKLRFYSEEDANNVPQRKFFHWLRLNGFLLITTPLRTVTVEGEPFRHTNLAAMMATDLVLSAHSGEREFILISGNGELAYTVSKLGDMGCRVELASFHCRTSPILTSVCDEVMDLGKCAEILVNRGTAE